MTSPLLLFILPLISFTSCSASSEQDAILLALDALVLARTRASSLISHGGPVEARLAGPWGDCMDLYENSEARVRRLVGPADMHDATDASTWLAAALTSHRTCMDGLREKNVTVAPSERGDAVEGRIRQALAVVARRRSSGELLRS